MKMKALTILAISTLAASAYADGRPQQDKSKFRIPAKPALAFTGVTTIRLSTCNPDPDQIKAKIFVHVPADLTLSNLPLKAVSYRKRDGYDPLRFDSDPALPTDDTDDDVTSPTAGPALSRQPFHVYIGALRLKYRGFVAVRILLNDTKNFKFYEDEDEEIYGVGVSDASGSSSICGGDRVQRNGSKEVATFYISMRGIENEKWRSFNIVLRPVNAPDTPIVIDPKVHNDGTN